MSVGSPRRRGGWNIATPRCAAATNTGYQRRSHQKKPTPVQAQRCPPIWDLLRTLKGWDGAARNNASR